MTKAITKQAATPMTSINRFIFYFSRRSKSCKNPGDCLEAWLTTFLTKIKGRKA